MTERLREHLARVSVEFLDDGYIPRLFRTADDWDKWSSYEWRGHRLDPFHRGSAEVLSKPCCEGFSMVRIVAVKCGS